MCILPTAVVECCFANRSSSSVLTNRMWSVANHAFNAVLALSSAVVANCSLNAVVVKFCSYQSCVLGHTYMSIVWLFACFFSLLCLRAYCLLLLFMCILPIAVVECCFANRSSSSVLTNRMWSVANHAFNAVLALSSAVVANCSLNAVVVNRLSSSVHTNHVFSATIFTITCTSVEVQILHWMSCDISGAI